LSERRAASSRACADTLVPVVHIGHNVRIRVRPLRCVDKRCTRKTRLQSSRRSKTAWAPLESRVRAIDSDGMPPANGKARRHRPARSPDDCMTDIGISKKEFLYRAKPCNASEHRLIVRAPSPSRAPAAASWRGDHYVEETSHLRTNHSRAMQ
jgi:hypothetical protein